VFVERESHLAQLSADKGYYYAANTVNVHCGGFEENAPLTITISDPTRDIAVIGRDGLSARRRGR
jgi:hypothetical protein